MERAKSFRYPTVWVNRFNQPLEELDVRPDRTVTDLNGRFYEAVGFVVMGQSPLDDTGRPHPIVHLRREAPRTERAG